MTILPKTPKPTDREEREAYNLAVERDGNVCLFRSSECAGAVQLDHRRNRSQGGLTILSNLQSLCVIHHDWKTNHPEEALAQCLGVPGHHRLSPAEYPASRWVQTVYGMWRLVFVLYWDAPVGGEWWTEITDEEAGRRMNGLVG